MSSRKLQLTSAIILTFALQACGGGGSSSTQTDSTTPTNSNPISSDTVSNDDTGNDTEDDLTQARLSITSQPSSQTLASGQSVNLSLSVDSSDSYTITWYKDGVQISQSSTFQISSIDQADSGSYGCSVSSGSLTDQCDSFSLQVLDAPNVTQSPSNQMVTEGESVNLQIQASGSSLSYQWYFNGQPLFGEISSELSLSNVSANQEGNYYCVVTNAVGEDTSSTASLSVYEATVYGQVDVTWTKPATRADGSALSESEIYGYKVYFGPSDLNGFTDTIEVTSTQATIDQLELGDYKVAVSTIDNNGYESELSSTFLVAVQ